MRNVRAVVLVLVVLGATLLGAGTLTPRGVAAAESSQQVRYNRFDVDIAIAPSGDFRVTERQDIAFLSGTFRRASRNIGLSRVDDIRDIAVSEGGRAYTLAPAGSQTPNTYSVRRSETALTIEWYFPATSGQRRPFEIAYTVVGGLRINPDLDVLDWAALRADLPADASASTVTVTLPRAVEPAQLKTDSRGASARATVADGQSARFVAGAVPRGRGLEVKVSFPHGLVTAAPPRWQSNFEQQQQARERRDAYRNLVNLLLGALGILILLGGGIGLYLLWYLRGRDRYTGLVADYLREPPSDIGPGVAGTLLDERADLQDVLATFTDLGHRGVLRISETQTEGVLGFGGGRDFAVERLPSDAPLTAFERTMVDTLFPGGTTTVQLSEAKGRFTAALPHFAQQLYGEVVERGYFEISPEIVRNRYRTFGNVLLGVAIVGGIGLFFLFGSALGGLIIPALGLTIIALALRSLSRAMPVKTERGAEEAAKWKAFRRYLANLEQYDNLADAKGIFEQYLPYATAFGLDKGFIQKFASVDTPVPSWYGGPGGYYGGPGGYYGGGPIIIGGPGGGYYGGGNVGGGQPAPGGGDGGVFHIPSLQDMSDRGGGGLQSMSEGLAGMLSSASSVFGGGGGGGSDSGWSGGGGGGFDFGGGGGGGDSGGGGDFG